MAGARGVYDALIVLRADIQRGGMERAPDEPAHTTTARQLFKTWQRSLSLSQTQAPHYRKLYISLERATMRLSLYRDSQRGLGPEGRTRMFADVDTHLARAARILGVAGFALTTANSK